MKCAGSKVRPSRRPGPATRTRLASPSSAWLMVTEMGLRARGCPPREMCTRCSPTSCGTKEIPAGTGTPASG